MEGFLLGLASGITCMAYCAPVLVPLMLGAGQSTRRNGLLLAQFLGGRLVGYLLFGFLAWQVGRIILTQPLERSVVFGASYILLAGLLLYFGLAKPVAACAISLSGARKWLARWPALLPFGLGLLTGLNLCPPFLLAFTDAAQARNLSQSLLLFATFFLGTSVYLLPIPFLGIFRGRPGLAAVGRMAAVLVALYYFYSGILTLVGGLTQL